MVFNKKFYFLVLILVFVLIIFSFFQKNNPIRKNDSQRESVSNGTSKSEVILGGKTFSVEVADTNLLRERGLSGHKPLGEYEGMLFIFQKPDRYGFWMKDMLFSLDILWLDENYKIIHIEKNLSPKTYPKVFYPEAESQYVLEISAGSCSMLGIKVGDSLVFIKNNP